jgi:hypothetical protein
MPIRFEMNIINNKIKAFIGITGLLGSMQPTLKAAAAKKVFGTACTITGYALFRGIPLLTAE